MQAKSPKWLDAIRGAATFIVEASGGHTYFDYEANLLLRSAIERNIENIGESLIRLERADPTVGARITGYRKIIGLRNRLAHGYDTEVDNRVVWDIVQNSVPVLLAKATALLAEAE